MLVGVHIEFGIKPIHVIGLMQKEAKGFSLIDFIFAIIILGVVGFVSMQGYFKWSESFRGQEGADQLKKIKSKIEVCSYAKPNLSVCLQEVETEDTLHFKCCEGKDNSKNHNVTYAMYAIRNDNDMSIVDVGGQQPSCLSNIKPIERDRSGVGLCRHVDGTFTVEGWGIYKGIY